MATIDITLQVNGSDSEADLVARYLNALSAKVPAKSLLPLLKAFNGLSAKDAESKVLMATKFV